MTANNTSTGTAIFDHWGKPVRIEVNEYLDSIEIIYKETSMIISAIHPSPAPEERAFKIIFSVLDGKWHKSERIYGIINPSNIESYTFRE